MCYCPEDVRGDGESVGTETTIQFRTSAGELKTRAGGTLRVWIVEAIPIEGPKTVLKFQRGKSGW